MLIIVVFIKCLISNEFGRCELYKKVQLFEKSRTEAPPLTQPLNLTVTAAKAKVTKMEFVRFHTY